MTERLYEIISKEHLMTSEILKTCCFTGHRSITNTKQISREISAEISKLYNLGVRKFISGMAQGFDLLAAKEVAALKQKFKDIELVLAIPCRDQALRWNKQSQIIYQTLVRQADEVVYLSPYYNKYCMLKRDRYMVDNSGYVIAFLTKRAGGTFYTVKYAEKLERKIINLAKVGEEIVN